MAENLVGSVRAARSTCTCTCTCTFTRTHLHSLSSVALHRTHSPQLVFCQFLDGPNFVLVPGRFSLSRLVIAIEFLLQPFNLPSLDSRAFFTFERLSLPPARLPLGLPRHAFRSHILDGQRRTVLTAERRGRATTTTTTTLPPPFPTLRPAFAATRPASTFALAS